MKKGYFEEKKENYSLLGTLGHRDFPNVTKKCPCFDAKTEYGRL
jgi:hypothetical protein